MSTIEHAIALAAQAHAGHKNKAGEPYILHPLRVMLRMKLPEEQMAAVLHDVVEDSGLTFDDLRRQGFPEMVIEAVKALTHGAEEDYDDAIRRAAEHPLACKIKIADLEDNIRMAQAIGDAAKLEKYRHALGIISGYSDGR